MCPTALLLAISLLGSPTDVNALLERGAVVSVEQNADGKFKQATAVARVNAPLEQVWNTIVDYKDYATFVPKVVKSEVVHEEPGVIDVKFELDTPGIDTKYVMRHNVHADTHTIEMNWVKGDLKGSHWLLRAESTPDGKTIISYAGATKNFSGVLESLEDDRQTITIGVNVSSALTYVNAIKRKAEGK